MNTSRRTFRSRPSVHVPPPGRLIDLPGVDRGELLCEAYEWFTFDVPDTRLTLVPTHDTDTSLISLYLYLVIEAT